VAGEWWIRASTAAREVILSPDPPSIGIIHSFSRAPQSNPIFEWCHQDSNICLASYFAIIWRIHFFYKS
jgi:hypothetical protein